MITLISPSNTMNSSDADLKLPQSNPIFDHEAELIAQKMSMLSIEQLEQTLHLSRDLAQVNRDRYHNFDNGKYPPKQAFLSYAGSVYRNIDLHTMNQASLEYLQAHVLIISSLYGLLRPFDLIKPYRINFHLKIDSIPGKDLYEFWRMKITDQLNSLAIKDDGIIINLTSKEVEHVIDTKSMSRKVQFIKVEFKENKGDGKFLSERAYAKPAEGRLIDYITRNQLNNSADLKLFTWNGYVYNSELSNNKEYVFTR